MATGLGDLSTGAVIGDRYRLEEPLGSGSTAHVWRARDRELGRVVAIKLLGDGVESELAARFGREGEILGRLSHPNLVAVLGTGVDGDRPFLIMELVEGTPLDVVLQDGPMPWDDACRMLADVAAGLGEAHRHGVLHRDVKPANVLCGRDGVPRLVDFGIARVDDLTTMTRADMVLGTATYLAPEQAQARQLTPAADVYSMGCVLFEAVAGRPPFQDDRPLSVALLHVNEEPPLLSATAAGAVPDDVDAVVARCLAKSPTARYQTAAELEADLRRVADGEAPLLAGPRAPADDPDATTTLATAPPAAASGTMVLPAMTVSDGGEVVDRSPLVTRTPSGDAVRMRNVALIGAAVLLLVLLLAGALGGSGGDEAPPEPAADQTPTSEAAPPPEEPAPAPPPDEGGGRGKDKAKKND